MHNNFNMFQRRYITLEKELVECRLARQEIKAKLYPLLITISFSKAVTYFIKNVVHI